MAKVTTICGGSQRVWSSRKEAIAFFEEGVMCSEGSEQSRYVNILIGLRNGLKVCTDEYLSLL